MKLKQIIKPLAAAALLGATATFVIADAAPSSVAGKNSTSLVQAISAPSSKHNVSFFDVGIVREVMVKPGDAVKVGQVLATEDSDLEQLQLSAMQIEANSTSEIDAAKKDRDAKKLMADNMAQAYKNNAATFSEKEEAALAYDESVIKIQYAQEQHDQKQVQVEKEKKKIDKMKLLSPVDGIVQKINLQAGEVVDPNKPDGALTIVQNSPLWADMHLPSAVAAKLKIGDTLDCAYANDPDNWVKGSIIYFDPVVDAASDTQTVRMQLENKEHRPAGLQLNVRLPFSDGKSDASAASR